MLRRFVLPLLLALPVLSWAGAHDYFECTGPGGEVIYSVERCPKGQKVRRIEDDQAPVSRNLGAAGASVIRLQAGEGGHFYAMAAVNGVPVRFLVDTGATLVSIGPTAARRARIDTRRGVQGMSQTANGTAPMTMVVLNSVELGGSVVQQVRGDVMAQDMPGNVEGLLGMSFLRHFEVTSDGGVMTLRRK